MTATPQPPKHLSKTARAWFRSIVTDYELTPTHLRLLVVAAESLDQIEATRSALAAHGTDTYDDRFGQPHARPEVAILRNAKISFCRLLTQINLSDDDGGTE